MSEDDMQFTPEEQFTLGDLVKPICIDYIELYKQTLQTTSSAYYSFYSGRWLYNEVAMIISTARPIPDLLVGVDGNLHQAAEYQLITASKIVGWCSSSVISLLQRE